MSKHIIDRHEPASKATLLRRFAEVERKAGPNKATVSLQHRPKQRPTAGDARLRAYIDIERGKEG